MKRRALATLTFPEQLLLEHLAVELDLLVSGIGHLLRHLLAAEAALAVLGRFVWWREECLCMRVGGEGLGTHRAFRAGVKDWRCR